MFEAEGASRAGRGVADIFPEDTPAVTATAKLESPFATRSILGVNVAVCS
jgi:hypothetical protein